MDLDPAPAELLDEIYGDEVAGCKGWKSVYATSSGWRGGIERLL